MVIPGVNITGSVTRTKVDYCWDWFRPGILNTINFYWVWVQFNLIKFRFWNFLIGLGILEIEFSMWDQVRVWDFRYLFFLVLGQVQIRVHFSVWIRVWFTLVWNFSSSGSGSGWTNRNTNPTQNSDSPSNSFSNAILNINPISASNFNSVLTRKSHFSSNTYRKWNQA